MTYFYVFVLLLSLFSLPAPLRIVRRVRIIQPLSTVPKTISIPSTFFVVLWLFCDY